MEMIADLPRRRDGAAEFLRHDRGLQRPEAKAHPGGGRCRRGDGVREAGLSVQIEAVGRDLDAGEDELAIALGIERSSLRRDLLQGQRADAAARIGDDAVGAEIVAAVLDLEHGPGAAEDGAGGKRFEHAAPEGIVHKGLKLPLLKGLQNIGDEGVLIAAAVHDVGADGLRVGGAELAPAAADSRERAGVLLAQAADRLAGFAPALRRDGAGIDDDEIDRLPLRCGLKALLLQEGLHGLRLVLVDLAAESGYNVTHNCHSKR